MFHRAAYKPEDFPRDGRPQIAIVGRSNVGKSSLINSILRKKSIARVSQTPGKTQAIQFYLINDKFFVVDLPGYGYAKVPRSMTAAWGTLIRSYFETTDALRSVLLLLDARRTPSEDDLMLRDWLENASVAWHPVLTKTDKLSNNELAQSRRTIAAELERDPKDLILFSKVTGKGTDDIWKVLLAAMPTKAK
ncbi:MAG: ribosome biogenesis GTP-binding protein YihA/YsxC [Thermoanaerobaculia bacterium]